METDLKITHIETETPPPVPRSELKRIEHEKRAHSLMMKAARQKRYRDKHPKRAAKSTGDARKKNPERVNAAARARYAAVPEEVREEINEIKRKTYAARQAQFSDLLVTKKAEHKAAKKAKGLKQRARDLALFLKPS